MTGFVNGARHSGQPVMRNTVKIYLNVGRRSTADQLLVILLVTLTHPHQAIGTVSAFCMTTREDHFDTLVHTDAAKQIFRSASQL